MKKIFTIFVLVVLLVATQVAGGGKMPMGVRAGLNIASRRICGVSTIPHAVGGGRGVLYNEGR
jgi:hypothetical protein